MGQVRILDCTLRDGGRCFGNTWGDENIKSISYGLAKSNIDIIEIGFLYYIADGICRENMTHFREFSEVEPFLYPNQNYVIYVEHIVFAKGSFEIIPKEKSSISGIRLGILKNEIYDAVKTMKDIINKGYQLYVQGINILSYSKEELLEFISVVNEVKPYAFAIVDTFGNLELDELMERFELINKHLNRDIVITLHSHNNKQLSFALAVTFMKISSERDIVIDGTLCGIGMGAGNLNTELIAQYLNEKNGIKYDINILSNLIDKYIKKFQKKFSWGYSVVAYDAAGNWRSQMEVSYITTKYHMIPLEEQRYLLAMCPINNGIEMERIDGFYKLLHADFPDMDNHFEKLKKVLSKKRIVLVGRGPSVSENKEKIEEIVKKNDAVVIYINAHSDEVLNVNLEKQYYFFTREACYQYFIKNYCVDNIISFAGFCKEDGLQKNVKNEYVLHLKQVVDNPEQVFDDGVIWGLNLLNTMFYNIRIDIAGFDGSDANSLQIQKYKDFLLILKKNNTIHFLTDSVYEDVEKEDIL